MAVRPMKVWNAATSTWDDVAVNQRGDVVNATDFVAKGDIITGTGAAAYDNLAVGSNGDTLVADSSASAGVRWQPNYNAGRNRIINGGFDVWQRGTSFSSPSTGDYTADRWVVGYADAVPTSRSITRQAFTAGSAPVAGYEGTFFARSTVTTVGSTTVWRPFTQRIEDVRTFSGQTVTVSFWAKADSNRNLIGSWQQLFGSGGSSFVGGGQVSFSLTTSWQRFSFSFAPPSVSGKTIGPGSYLEILFQQAAASGSVLDLWGVQLEAGSVATRFEEEPFEATLRKCQRYYEKSYNVDTAPGTVTYAGRRYGGAPVQGLAGTTGYIGGLLVYAVPKRATPTLTLYDMEGTAGAVSASNIGAGETHGNSIYVDSGNQFSVCPHRDGFAGTRTSAHAFSYHFTASAEL